MERIFHEFNGGLEGRVRGGKRKGREVVGEDLRQEVEGKEGGRRR